MTSRSKIEKKKVEEPKIPVESTFVPPDGGWGWMVVLAAGFANFCLFPVVQNFGLLFRDKFVELGINSSQTTVIINVSSAVTSCIGLANGPLFRKFSYRQVSLAGASVSAISISILSTMKTFSGVLIFFSILYGAGMGTSQSANALALNTYFKKKRRIATGFSWTCTGLGPIIMPQVITLLIPIYGMEGTVLIFGGFTFNAVVGALLLQPVSWHVKKNEQVISITEMERGADQSGAALLNETQAKSLENINGGRKLTADNRFGGKFGSQYLYYDDEEQGAVGLDVVGPGTPMMSRANDGWYSRQSIAASNTSLSSNKTFKRENSQKNLSRYPSLSLSRQSSWKALSRGPSLRALNKQKSESDNEKNTSEKTAKRKLSTLPSVINSPLIKVTESCEHDDECVNDNCSNEECIKRKLTYIFNAENGSLDVEPITGRAQTDDVNELDKMEPRDPCCKRFFRAVVIFFDLDLLKDMTYVNLTMGLTFGNFAEINFSLLTPFILSDFGFTKQQTATVMSLLAGFDVATRMAIPFVAGWIEWQNKFFFLLGICMMATGRIGLAYIQDYTVVLFLAIWIGIGKAFKTVFMALVIPSHVPLERLPAASGLQLLVSGTVYLVLGPLVGWVRDATGDFALMLQCLNIFTVVTAISWIGESWYTKCRDRKKLLEKQMTADVEKS